MWNFIKSYPLRYWPWYLAGLITLLITTYVTTLIPLEIKTIIDLISDQGNWQTLKSHVIKLITLAVILAIVRTFSRVLIFTPGRYVEYDLRKVIHAHLLTLPPSFFRTHTIGDTMSRMINDIQALRLMSAVGYLNILNTFMIYTFVVVQMVLIHPMLTFWTLLPIPFALIVIRFFVFYLYTFIRRSQEQLGTITDFFVEAVANIGLIKTFTAEERIIDEMQHDNVAYRKTQIKLASVRSIMFPFIATIGSLGQIIIIYKGGQYYINNLITIGDIVAFSTYLVLLAWPTAAFSWIINIIQRGVASLERIQDILDTSPHPQFNSTDELILTKPPKIELQNISFKYNSDQSQILSNINLSIPAGSTLGIFGATGSGKTSLVKLLSLIEPVQSGSILFNDTDVTCVNVNSLRAKIATVPQRRFLFSSSIKENIMFSAPELMEQNIYQTAASRACVLDDIQTFPDEWNTLVGEKGIILSGGQQHRLALARAYASNHHVLILDDVLSSVDHDTEQQMIRAIYQSDSRPTSIIISHRISAIEPCDQIIVLDKGVIIDQGTHSELIDKPGPYQATWNYQQMEHENNV